MIGKVVSKLEETGLRDKTLIMIAGDNGTGWAIILPLPQRGYVYGGKGYPSKLARSGDAWTVSRVTMSTTRFGELSTAN